MQGIDFGTIVRKPKRKYTYYNTNTLPNYIGITIESFLSIGLVQTTKRTLLIGMLAQELELLYP